MAQYFTNFGDDTIGQPPVGWTTRSDTLALTVIADANASNGVTLQWGPGSAIVSSCFASWDAIDSDPLRADFEILVRGYAETSDSGGVNCASSGGRAFVSGRFNGYGAGNRTTNFRERAVVSTAAGTRKVIGTLTGSDNLTSYSYSRFRVNGSSLKYKAWPGSLGDEPAEWDVDLTNTTHTGAGWVGIWKGLRSTNSYYDWIGVGTGGDAAPSGPVGGGGSGTFAAPAVSVTPTISAGSLAGAQSGASTAPSLSITPTITAGTLVGNQAGDFSAPSLTVAPAISAGTLSGAQTGTATAPSLSVQPVISAGTLLGSGAGTFTAPSVSVTPVVSAGTLTGAQTGNFLGPAVSVQPSISAGTLTGASGATFLAPTLSVTPVVSAGTLTGAQTGTATAPTLSVQPTVSAGVLVGQQGGNFLGPALFVHPSISSGTLSGIAVSSGAFVAPGVSVHPVIRAGYLSGGSTDYRVATIMAERREFIVKSETRQFIMKAERKY